MDRDAALHLLGLPPDASPEALRQRYLALIKQHHPDVASGVATVDAADLTEAYRVASTPFVTHHDADRRTQREKPNAAPTTVDGDTLSLALPPDEAFLCLLDVASTIGVVTYVDPEGGLLEVQLDLSDGRRCSVVASLQGRAAFGSTDVFLTVDDLDTAGLEQIALELAALLDGSLNS